MPPSRMVNTRIDAWPGLATAGAMKLSIERPKAAKGFQSKRIRAPPKMPRKSDTRTSLVISARQMATSGGSTDSQPGRIRSRDSAASEPEVTTIS